MKPADHRATSPQQAHWGAADFALLRTPLLPFDDYLSWGQGSAPWPSADEPKALAAFLDVERPRLRRRLTRHLDSPLVREALYGVSTHLYRQLDSWRRSPTDKRGRAAEASLVKVWARLTGRANPHGLCAGTTVVPIGREPTCLRLGPRAHYRSRTHIDMRALVALADDVARRPAARRRLRYRPNDSLHLVAGVWRYVETRPSTVHPATRSYGVVSCANDPYLEAVLDHAAGGATRDALARHLVDDEEELEAARAFIDELIDAQVLVADLEPAMTGERPPDESLADSLRAVAPTTAEALTRALDGLAAIDRQAPGRSPARYEALRRPLQGAIDAPLPPYPWKSDLLKPSPGVRLHRVVIEEVARGCALLASIARPRPRQRWDRWRRRFERRFGDQEVPLATALDPEIGIALGDTPDTAKALRAAVPAPLATDIEVRWSAADARLLRKVEAGGMAIELDADDLAVLRRPSTTPLPPCLVVLATLIGGSAADLDAGRFHYRILGQRPSAKLLGRFAWLDQGLREGIADLLRHEAAFDDQAVPAEIVHFPMSETASNVLARPCFGGLEIPYLGRSGAPAAQQLPIADLRLAVRDGRFVLRSRRLGRPIAPRLTNAHAYDMAGHLPIYRFLAGLQERDLRRLPEWHWSPVLAEHAFLPRLTCGRLIISAARWRLDEADLRGLDDPTATASIARVRRWRATRGLPRLVTLDEYDRRLPFDLDNALAVEALLRRLRGRDLALLEELVPGPDALCVGNAEGSFHHELLVPLVRRPAPKRTSVPPRRAEATPVTAIVKVAAEPADGTRRRRFVPGSPWLYARLYTTGSLADQALLDIVRPLVAQLRRRAQLARWFFIRYDAPRPHLRLRLRASADTAAQRQALLEGLTEHTTPALEDGRLHDLELATYRREAVRYGGLEAIATVEAIFEADSDAVLTLLATSEGPERWRASVATVDTLLAAFDYDRDQRYALLIRLRDGYRREFAGDADFVHRVGALARRERAPLEAMLAGRHPHRAVLDQRAAALAPPVARLRALAATGRLTRPLDDIVLDLVHLHMDRLLRGDLRRQEAVLYDLMARAHRARRARERVTA